MMQKILVTGGDGLLAHAFKQCIRPGMEWIFLGHSDFDLTQPSKTSVQLDRLRPGVVINTAAYNLVDRCEIERDLSWAVNATGPQALAEICAKAGIRLVHYGTDYVFDGEKGSPYVEGDSPNPLNHYAAGKLFGEQAVLRASAQHLVLRTSWIFGAHPTQSKSYVHTVLRAARAGQTLKATTDQISVPTFALDLARWTVELVRLGARGLLHVVNDDPVSRFAWTCVILDECLKGGLISKALMVEPVTTAYFNPTIRRPAYSVLNNERAARLLGSSLGSWREGLRKMLAQEPGR